MNRDIEFRGKAKDNEWIYGYYHKETSTSIALQEYGINEINTHYIHTVIDHLPFKIEVIPETIGQYTGLKDKNGKKIFEGDILRTPAWLYGEEKVCICKYNQENNVNSIIGFGLYTNDAYFKKYQELVECDEWDEFEVIGNIYENKELLEG